MALYNWIFQTENFVDKKKITLIIKHKKTKIAVKNSYFKIKIKDWKVKFLPQYLHYMHYSDRTLIN